MEKSLNKEVFKSCHAFLKTASLVRNAVITTHLQLRMSRENMLDWSTKRFKHSDGGEMEDIRRLMSEQEFSVAGVTIPTRCLTNK